MSTAIDPTVCPLPDVELIETDGEPLETLWHRHEIALLIEVIEYLLRGRHDFFVAGNMFIYFSVVQVRNRDYRGPDFFFVNGVNREPMRPYWAVWEEGGRYPDVIVELLSPSTAREDRTTKKDIYERIFHTYEYYCYDPDAHHLEGWRLRNKHYEPIAPDERGWLWCEELELWLGNWGGKYLESEMTWLRFFDGEGRPVPTFGEGAQQEAEAARQQAEAARQQAEAAQQQAEAERKRAEAAEGELALLRARLAQQGNAPGNGG